MTSHNLLDVLAKKGKAAGGYCTTIPDYKAPFIFANFNNTQHDVEVMTMKQGMHSKPIRAVMPACWSTYGRPTKPAKFIQ